MIQEKRISQNRLRADFALLICYKGAIREINLKDLSS
jgi:hypothetical protein